MLLKKEEIKDLDNRYRALFITALSGYKSANLIGTCDHEKNTNLAIFSSVFHLGSHPSFTVHDYTSSLRFQTYTRKHSAN